MLKNTLWLLSEKLIKLLGAVVVSALIARHLQPEGFGILNFYLAILSILIVASSLGLNRIVIREIVSSKLLNERSDIVKTTFYLRLLASFIIFSAAIFLASFFVSDHENYYSIIIFLCIIFNASDVLDFYQQGISDFKKVSVARLAAFLVSVLLKLSFVFFNMDLVWFLVANLFEYVLASLLIYKFCARIDKVSLLKTGKFSYSKARDFVCESWPEVIAGFSSILFLKMDQVMLYYLSSDKEVGIYSAAARLSEAWYFIPAAIIATTFPKIIELKNKNSEDYMRGIKYLITFMILMAFTVAIIVSFFGHFFVLLIFGDAYRDSSAVLNIHIWSSVFLCLGLVSGSWLIAEKRLKLNLYRNLFGLAVNFLLNMFLIPKYGAVGAAWAMVFGLASAYLFFNLFNSNLRWVFFVFFMTPFRVFDKDFFVFFRNKITRKK